MQRAIRPDWLIRQARELADPGHRGQPRNADLRRAVSAAYYALFHHIALEMCRQILPNGTERDHLAMTRRVQHAAVKQVCNWVGGGSKPPEPLADSVDAVKAVSALVDVAVTFPALIEARERADYDHLARLTKVDTLSNVQLAEESIKKLDSVKGCREREIFLACIALRTS